MPHPAHCCSAAGCVLHHSCKRAGTPDSTAEVLSAALSFQQSTRLSTAEVGWKVTADSAAPARPATTSPGTQLFCCVANEATDVGPRHGQPPDVAVQQLRHGRAQVGPRAASSPPQCAVKRQDPSESRHCSSSSIAAAGDLRSEAGSGHASMSRKGYRQSHSGLQPPSSICGIIACSCHHPHAHRTHHQLQARASSQDSAAAVACMYSIASAFMPRCSLHPMVQPDTTQPAQYTADLLNRNGRFFSVFARAACVAAVWEKPYKFVRVVVPGAIHPDSAHGQCLGPQ